MLIPVKQVPRRNVITSSEQSPDSQTVLDGDKDDVTSHIKNSSPRNPGGASKLKATTMYGNNYWQFSGTGNKQITLEESRILYIIMCVCVCTFLVFYLSPL